MAREDDASVLPISAAQLQSRKDNARKYGLIKACSSVLAATAGAGAWQYVADQIDGKEILSFSLLRNLLLGMSDATISIIWPIIAEQIIIRKKLALYVDQPPLNKTSLFLNTVLLSSLWQLFVDIGQYAGGGPYDAIKEISSGAKTIAVTSTLLSCFHIATYSLSKMTHTKYDKKFECSHWLTSALSAVGFYLAGPLPLGDSLGESGKRNWLGSMACTGTAALISEFVILPCAYKAEEIRRRKKIAEIIDESDIAMEDDSDPSTLLCLA